MEITCYSVVIDSWEEIQSSAKGMIFPPVSIAEDHMTSVDSRKAAKLQSGKAKPQAWIQRSGIACKRPRPNCVVASMPPRLAGRNYLQPFFSFAAEHHNPSRLVPLDSLTNAHRESLLATSRPVSPLFWVRVTVCERRSTKFEITIT